MKTVKVYGPGCARCKQTEGIVRMAMEQAGVEATLLNVHDYQQMAADVNRKKKVYERQIE